MEIYYSENEKGGVSLKINSPMKNNDLLQGPADPETFHKFATYELELDGARLDNEEAVYLQEMVDLVKQQTGATKCSPALQEFGVK